MRPEQEQELAYTLLVELLAYQFASPDETQDVILAEHAAERIVEIGPSDTLVEWHGGPGLQVRSIRRCPVPAAPDLCYNKDAKEIYYDVEPGGGGGGTRCDFVGTGIIDSTSRRRCCNPSPWRHLHPAPVGRAIDDAPVQATDIAIKDLVNGKSTLQNEILGKEFGATPEKPEDVPLDELGGAFQSTFNGQLGKQSSSLIARLVQ
ncbi:fatty acid synthetase [Sphaerosporella brunnea]|uniref:beta-ketoacyl-[acyl-carrier-protein] synthase I n=1 Tax=Sphaerosporella brunnea TaxID=1250544 RepID=A0A5J5EPM7_9PEZI|nr:fatty acid synthetase [Sphaerosporella brunnea]